MAWDAPAAGRLADLVPEALLRVAADGRVLAANPAAARLFGRTAAELAGQPLQDLVEEGAAEVAGKLQLAARSGSLVPFGLTLRLPGGAALSCRADGARLAEDAGGLPVLLLRLARKEHAGRQFLLLRDRIDELSREILRRREAEAELRRALEERQALARELMDKTRRLEEADRRKNEFLSMLAHELRNPLAPLRSGIEVLRQQHADLPGLARVADMMHRQVGHMAHLLDDLLDVARVTRGEVHLERAPLALDEVLAQALETARPLLDAREMTVVVDPPVPQATVVGDMTRLVQVFGNLLANAARFSPVGSRLQVVTRLVDGEATVAVRDEGEGIAPELLPRVFDLFVQGERTLDRRQGGLGIGLTVARTLARLHGGDITASSPGRGGGSTFTVRLPARPGPPALAPAPAAAREPDRPAHSILVVDDNEDAAESLATLASLWGHQVAVAHAAQAALQHVRMAPPAVVLLDIGLPDMDGYALARALRAEPAMAGATLIAVTGYGDAAARQRSRAAGMDHHLTKPVDAELLRRLLSESGTTRA